MLPISTAQLEQWERANRCRRALCHCAREQALKQQVCQLQIKIDRTKQEKQVAEITGTDFFQQLEVKAARLRRSLADPNPETE